MKNYKSVNKQKTKIRIKKLILITIGFLISVNVVAQSQSEVQINNSPSVFSNPVFIALTGVIIILIFVILALGKVLVAASSNAIRKKSNDKVLGLISLIIFQAFSKTSNAQEMVALPTNPLASNTGLLYMMLIIIGFEILIIVVLMHLIQLFTKKENIWIAKIKPSLFEKLNATVPIEKEKDILLDHNYDGIRELDNDLPPWWKYGFYFSIVFAFIYLIHYHVLLSGDLQIAEYNKSIRVAVIEKAEFEKNNLNNVNESNAVMLTDKAELAKGEVIFKGNCFACHGKLGEGGVGPNLTDDFWIHGGSIKDIFKTIKYGYPDKGMKSWQADLSSLQINELASYIKTLYGSRPANGKSAQGDMYVELTNQKDSLKTEGFPVPQPIIESPKAGH
jgi:cytochrome c oxidase cbb3-type subunit 3